MARTVAILCFAVAAGLTDRPVLAAAIGVLAAALVIPTLRRKADPAPDAVYTSGADMVARDAKRFPGQLSLTADRLIWTPSRYSVRRGQEPIAVELRTCRHVTLDRGVGLLDVILTVVPSDGRELHFCTHTSRRLKRTLEGLEARRAAVGA